MDDIMQVPLHVLDVRLLSTHRTELGPGLICVESTRQGTRWRRCGPELRARHGVEAVVRRRHLPLLDVPVLLEVRPQQ
jgi:hypothetical protein